MALRADVRVYVKIVVKGIFAGQFVQVWGDILSEQGQRLVSIAFLNIAQHLVVRAVLFDDVDDVLNGRWATRLFSELIHVRSNKACAQAVRIVRRASYRRYS